MLGERSDRSILAAQRREIPLWGVVLLLLLLLGFQVALVLSTW